MYSRQPDDQLQIGLDLTSEQADSVDFLAEFERLRQPIHTTSFYHQQWLALGELARQRSEPNEAYLKQTDEFIRFFSRD